MTEPRAIDIPLHADARGWLLATDKALDDVAYAYVSTCFPGAVKGWHRHQRHADRILGVWGLARVVVARRRGDEHAQPGTLATIWYETHEFVTGPLSPKLVVVPPGWWHAFAPAGNELCVVMNAPDGPYDPDDEERLELGAIPYEWGSVSG